MMDEDLKKYVKNKDAEKKIIGGTKNKKNDNLITNTRVWNVDTDFKDNFNWNNY